MKFIDVTIKLRLEMADDAPEGISEELEAISWGNTVKNGLTSGGMSALQIKRVIPGTRKLAYGSAEDARALKDQKLGSKPLRESVCDECEDSAYTRWYSGKGRSERIEASLCKKHNDAFLTESAGQRKRLGRPRLIKRNT